MYPAKFKMVVENEEDVAKVLSILGLPSYYFYNNSDISYLFYNKEQCEIVPLTYAPDSVSGAACFSDSSFPEAELSSDKKDILLNCVSTNPKTNIGSSKMQMSMMSPLATAYEILALTNGGSKYGNNNYRATPVVASIYLDAILRHLFAFLSGEEFDIDGVPHLGAIRANAGIIIDARSNGTLIDDRHFPTGYLQEVEKLTEISNKIKEANKEKQPKHYTIAQLQYTKADES